MSVLNAWMNGELVGAWQVSRGVHAFSYADTWLTSERRRPLSLSLPITTTGAIRGAAVESFFDNLLPDSPRIRERITRRFRTQDTHVFSLLEAIGRDCVGAIQLLPEGMEPEGWDRIDYEPLSETRLARLFQAAATDRVDDDESVDAFRISLAGAQEKTALLKVGRRWGLPLGATPTTHILKLPMGLIGGSRRINLSTSVQNEWLCAQILAELGLPVANTEMKTIGEQTVLVVERFDRAWMDGGSWITRLPQEDFCQALAVPPHRKYESDGGPGMDACLRLLGGSANPDNDRTLFLLAQLAFWLLAATDGHAKNYSIFHDRGDRYAMTPLYDVLSCWPYIGNGARQISWHDAKLAMAVRSKSAHYSLRSIVPRHWHGLAMKHGGPPLWDAMLVLVGRIEPALAAVELKLPDSFPAQVWDKIAAGMRGQARLFGSIPS